MAALAVCPLADAAKEVIGAIEVVVGVSVVQDVDGSQVGPAAREAVDSVDFNQFVKNSQFGFHCGH